MKIRTEHDPKPIPMRGFDWLAVDDEAYDGPGSPIGAGATEQEAVDDLLEQIGIESPPADWRSIIGVVPSMPVDLVNGREIRRYNAPDRFIYAVGKVGFFHLDEARDYARRGAK